jgi:fido (protein-threonine AMPylation protein)
MRVGYTDHLVGLLGRAEVAAARLARVPAEQRADPAASARSEASRLSARLDASPLSEATADATEHRLAAGEAVADAPPWQPPSDATGSGGGWASALGMGQAEADTVEPQDVAAVEYANLLACWDAEPGLAESLFAEPAETLRAAHRLLCHGLVAPEVAGRLRTTEQAVHDGATGRLIYQAASPGELPTLVEGLTRWLGRGSAQAPAMVVAGAVHQRLLQWQPLEAANGRLARVAARLVLRARGLDPDGVAVAERVLAEDPLSYAEEVAATVRRDDLGPWLERYAEAVVAGLERAAEAADPRPAAAPPARGVELCAELGSGERLTLPDYADRTQVSHEAAAADLRLLRQAGWVRDEPGSHGLTVRRC